MTKRFLSPRVLAGLFGLIIAIATLSVGHAQTSGEPSHQEPGRLTEFLEAHDLPADTVERILAQEGADPFSLEGAKVLSPFQALKSTHMRVETIREQYRRVRHAQKAVAISTLLALAGVTAMVVPLPGSRVLAVVLIKEGIAVAATGLAMAATGAYTSATVSEITSLDEIGETLRRGLNDIFLDTPVGRDLGEITTVKLSKRQGIEKFHTANHYDFRAETVHIPAVHRTVEETIFVSYTAWKRYFGFDRWFAISAKIYNDKVISLVDFLLYPRDAYLEMRTLEEKPVLNSQETLRLAQTVGRQILGAMAFRKRFPPRLDRDAFLALLQELDQHSGIPHEGPWIEHPRDPKVILKVLLEMRGKL